MKVLLIEDSPEIHTAVTLTFKLRWPDAIVIPVETGELGLKAAENESPDMVILDINLPDMNGFEVLENIRLFSDVPVIILTVRETEVDELRGLEMGADDYIKKPFSPANLLTRCRAVLRRSSTHNPERQIPALVAGNITIKFDTSEVLVDNNHIHLTPNEGRILHCLARRAGQVVSHDAIKQQVWGREAKFIENSLIKRYIYQLRNKLGDDSDSPRIIINDRSMGYRFIRPEANQIENPTQSPPSSH